MSELRACDKCGNEFPIDDLDAKPTMNSRMRRLQAGQGQLKMLERAANMGFNFDRLECARCYGPGYCSLTGVE